MFDLGLSDEQEQLQTAYRRLLERQCDTEVVRASEASGFASKLWAQITELGGVDMALPQAVGGGGASFVDAVLVLEVLGSFLAPVPLAEAVATTRLLATLGTEESTQVLAEVLASGKSVTLTPRPAIEGRLRFVPAGAIADVVVARDHDRIVALRGDVVLPYPRNLGALSVADRHVGDDAVTLASGHQALNRFDEAILEWRILMAAQLIGAGKRSLEIGVAYTKERYAFGVPIASFQTIAHRLADVATALDGAQLLTRKAAWSIDSDGPRWRALAQMAFVAASQAAQLATNEVLHFHGGYGFMLEYDIQLYFRRVKAWTLQNGDPDRALTDIADLLWSPRRAAVPAGRPV